MRASLLPLLLVALRLLPVDAAPGLPRPAFGAAQGRGGQLYKRSGDLGITYCGLEVRPAPCLGARQSDYLSGALFLRSRVRPALRAQMLWKHKDPVHLHIWLRMLPSPDDSSVMLVRGFAHLESFLTSVPQPKVGKLAAAALRAGCRLSRRRRRHNQSQPWWA